MKKIKIKFVDFFEDFNQYNNDFIDALKQKYEVELSENPDYIIYSAFGYEHLKYNCIRIYFTGECIVPNFNECDYAIGFDRMAFGDRYVRIPLYNFLKYKPKYQSLFDREAVTIDDVKGRGFCSFVVSNNYAKERALFYDRLSLYKPIASGGRYKNNIGDLVKDKQAFLSKYKFNIAFENCSYDGYATEKIVEAFAAKVIPIYYGDPRIASDFNHKAFINVHDYPSWDAVIDRIKLIDENDELYLRMLNEPIIQPNAEISKLSDFLYHIFDQPLPEAPRRPQSQKTIQMEEIKLRSMFFETKIYKYYKKGKNLLSRIQKGKLFLTLTMRHPTRFCR